jgi:RNA polymerase sigma-70 factor, ECF subfamily
MELLERFARGDPEAFEALFRQFQSEVYRWIVRIVRDPAAAEDLTVETFWRIHRAHARFHPDGSFGAWARRIATNVALDHLKRSRREVPLVEDFPEKSRPDPAVQRDTREKIAHAFAELPPRLRVAATLALVEEEPYEQIAEGLGISVNGVKTRVWRAVRQLRRKLKGLSVES